MYWLGTGSIVFVVLIIISDRFCTTYGVKCTVGREFDSKHVWRWVLPYEDPCQCTSIVNGGDSTIAIKRRFKPVYVNKPLFTSDVQKIRKHYGLKKCLTLTCPADEVISTDPGISSAVVRYPDPMVTTAYPTNHPHDVICSVAFGANLPIATTRVECHTFDRGGIKETCHFYITVEDNEPPSFESCPENQETSADPGLSLTLVEWEGPQATDNSDDTPTVVCDPPSGRNFTIGSSLVRCVATDSYRNENAEDCSFDVVVNDNEAPVFESCQNQPYFTDQGQRTAVIAWEDLVVATDNSGENPTVNCDQSSESENDIGSMSVTCQASDAHGNHAESCSFDVDVRDPISCYELMTARADLPNGAYWIDPTGPKNTSDAFQVHCERLTNNTIWTSIVHDSAYTEQFNKTFYDTKNIMYNVSMTQIEALFNVSHMCRQFLRADTMNIGTPTWSSSRNSWFENWGTPTGNSGCVCGLKQECANTQAGSRNNNYGWYRRCNGNADATSNHYYDSTDEYGSYGSNIWYSNEGYITDKDTLPVQGVHINGRGVFYWYGYYRSGIKLHVSPLECTGSQETMAEDTQPPVLVCNETHRRIPTTDASVHFSWVYKELSDNSGQVTKLLCEPAYMYYPLGTTMANCTAYDDAGNTARCSMTVEVIDVSPPNLYRCPDVRKPTVLGQSTTSVTWIIHYWDNSGSGYDVTCSHPSGSVFEIGSTPVICKVTDRSGNTGNCTFDVQVYARSLTCHTLKLASIHDDSLLPVDGQYLINPLGPTSDMTGFDVHCTMSTGATRINHNIALNHETNGIGTYDLSPLYDIDMDKIQALISASKNCYQDLYIETYNSRMFASDFTPFKWWVSADGEIMKNWGGPTGTYGCNCSVTGDCIDNRLICNSDISNGTLYTDGGRLADKTKLPVTSIHIVNTGSVTNQRVKLSLGPLECIGSSSPTIESPDHQIPRLVCPSDAVVRPLEFGATSSVLWWPFSHVSDNTGFVASIDCYDHTMVETSFPRGETDVKCVAVDNAGKRSAPCGLTVYSVYPYTCHEIKMLYPNAESGEFEIDPDGDGVALSVNCDLSTDTGKTIFSNSLLTESDVNENGEVVMKSWALYFQDSSDINNVIARSTHCKQSLEVRCHLSDRAERAQRFWYPRDQTEMYNWAAPTGTTGCQCGLLEGGCNEGNKVCNCDIDASSPTTETSLSDTGVLTDKGKLPVMGFYMGSGLSDDEFTLGSLECYGSIEEQDLTSSTNWGADTSLGWEIRGDREFPREQGSNVVVITGKEIPYDGLVTQWTYFDPYPTHWHPSWKALIWRYKTQLNRYQVIGVNEMPGYQPADVDHHVRTQNVPATEQVYARQGDRIGFVYPYGMFPMDIDTVDAVPCMNYSSAPHTVHIGFMKMELPDDRKVHRAYSIQATIKSANEPPLLTCPMTITETLPAGAVSVPVNWRYTEITDDNEVARLTCDPPNGSQFEQGVTEVTCIAIDDRGAETSCHFNVCVGDATCF